MEAYSVYIPAVVNGNPHLNLRQKHLYGRIMALADKKGYCYATNRFFAKELGVHRDTIKKDISALEVEKLIVVKTTKNNKGTKRKIFPQLNDPTGRAPRPHGGGVATPPPLGSKQPQKREGSIKTLVNIKKEKKETEKEKPLVTELPLDPLYPPGMPDWKSCPESELPQSSKEARKQIKYWCKEKIETKSKTSLNPCSIDEILHLAALNQIYHEDVVAKYRTIVEMINAGEFQKRYPYHKTLYRTLDRWLKMGIEKGYIEKITDVGELERLFQPKTGWLLPYNFKYRKMYRDLRERKQK